ncbi:hypothetical protein HV832_13985 [Undibacterium oligocarboniphilum]|uniref:Formyl transferase N-terminal domain-containing protein n=1 Tax=Undibacterium oligocarboniphilum TaxID=666702 RepID=A0A850QMS3_9BURK|nr:hypothetical protein [Undibacterium oligocarboniphilum]NVO78935.1 hypothetical protein [Undibacterium oligocarboniphilum]
MDTTTSPSLPKIAILVSDEQHALQALMNAQIHGNLGYVDMIISPSRDAEALARQYGVQFVLLPMEKQLSPDQESALLFLLRSHSIDLIIVAKFCARISGVLLNSFPHQVIGVHHSLPFSAAAFERELLAGVRLISARAFYLTTEINQGPVICEEVLRRNLLEPVAALRQRIQDAESLCLIQAVRLHLQNRIAVDDSLCVISTLPMNVLPFPAVTRHD